MAAYRRRHPPVGNRLPEGRSREPLAQAEFLRTLAREIARSERTGDVVSLMVLHLDRAVNSDYEHLLKYFHARLRLTDDVGWTEEFTLAVLLPSTPSEQALKIAAAVIESLGDAGARVDWNLYSSDRDQDHFESWDPRAQKSNGAGPSEPPEDPPASGGSGSPPTAKFPERKIPVVEPLAPLLMVPLPFGKRALDVVGSTLLLLMLSPLLLMVALAVRLDSRGPILFRQKRIGQGGRSFELLKFRTMVPNAELLLKELEKDNLRDGPAFKIRKDPRVTRIGRFLRANAMDELPQLWNVLMGDMTLVGPRPPLPKEVAHYESWQRARLRMVGGLTCIWQVEGRLRNVSFADWMRQDIRYGTQYSARRDLGLMVRTAWVVLAKRGDH